MLHSCKKLYAFEGINEAESEQPLKSGREGRIMISVMLMAKPTTKSAERKWLRKVVTSSELPLRSVSQERCRDVIVQSWKR